MSPISSRNSVPPRAAAISPVRAAWAPVKAPLTWPNNSSSTRFSGREAMFSATKGWSLRFESSCNSRAMSSFPVPVSPSISTEISRLATRAICSRNRCIEGETPISRLSILPRACPAVSRPGSASRRCDAASRQSTRRVRSIPAPAKAMKRSSSTKLAGGTTRSSCSRSKAMTDQASVPIRPGMASTCPAATPNSVSRNASAPSPDPVSSPE